MDGSNGAVSQVQAVFDAATRAAKARDDKAVALKLGRVDMYHRIVKSTPELPYVKPLLAVRRQLSTLARERRRVQQSDEPPERIHVQVEQLTQAMDQVAGGTMMWLGEKVPALALTSTMNSGEEQ